MNKKKYMHPEFHMIKLCPSKLICASNDSTMSIDKGYLDDDDIPKPMSDGNGGWNIWGNNNLR